jgi:hypothetical protein
MDAHTDPYCDAVAAYSDIDAIANADPLRHADDDANAYTLADSNIYTDAVANTNAFPHAHADAHPAPGGGRAG